MSIKVNHFSALMTSLLVLSGCSFPIVFTSGDSSMSTSDMSSISDISSSNTSPSSQESSALATYRTSLTISRQTWPSLSIYPSEETTVSFQDFTFAFKDAGNYTANVIQAKRSTFYLYNIDPIPFLDSIELTLRDTHEGHELYFGSTAQPSETTLEPTQTNTTYTYTFPSSYDQPYFHLINTGGVMYIESLIIYFWSNTPPESSSSAASEVTSMSSETTSTTSVTSASNTTSTTPSSSTPSSSTSNVSVVTNAPNYYQSISPSLTGEALKNALDTLISTNISVSYDWSRFEYADQHPTNTNQVLTIYPKLGYLKSAHVNGNAADHWNREHTYPQSKIGGGALNDNHHIFADDWKTNGTRGNNKFGDVANTEANRVLDSANRPTNNFTSGGYFEPNDEAKGEVARATLYMNTLYGYSLENNFQTAEMAVLWALQYPVNDWAMTRNNRVYDNQNNRNPYIDHPEWICDVYGTTSSATRQVCGL